MAFMISENNFVKYKFDVFEYHLLYLTFPIYPYIVR